MSSFNRVILIGNLTRDIELRYTAGGTAVCDIGVAVNDRRKTPNGEMVDEVTFVEVTLWGRNAEVAHEYLAKGSSVFIEGRLKYEAWEHDGQRKSRVKVVGERLQLIGGRRPEDRQTRRQEPEPSDELESSSGQGESAGGFDDGIPF